MVLLLTSSTFMYFSGFIYTILGASGEGALMATWNSNNDVISRLRQTFQKFLNIFQLNPSHNKTD